ncbi:FAD-dependent oxidoreductase [Aciduricibacillus chroicocephali]|uniref:FAD-dependent oxidoreductase n=1 Tax=Aciduricibacillus chroicocephali TaxID=3054939 RepID=A0ABY9L299_9BACI|nr:FAD-dependent oxidoreductase [Bacillaceae bacterium 44XB]
MTKSNLPEESKSAWLKNAGTNYPPLNESIEATVAIVGGGITGVTAAYLLAKSGVNTVLVEADRICGGTTGHTTAKISAQHGLIYDTLINNTSENEAKLYYQANVEAMSLIERLVKEHNIDCNYEKHDAYVYTNEKKQLEQLEKEADAYKKLGINGEMVNEIPLEIPMISALKMSDQAQFHPVKYIHALAEQAQNSGARIYEASPAEDIKPDDRPCVILRNKKEIKCDFIIIASHFPFWDKQGLYFARMEPQRSYVNAVTNPNKYPGGMYISAEQPTRSIRYMKDDEHGELWLIGGDGHKTGQGDPELQHFETLQEYAEDTFNAGETIYRWSAQDPVTVDKIPYIGRITEGKQQIMVATGYAKWGMTQGTIAAQLMTNLILKKESPYKDLYNPGRSIKGNTIKNTMSYNLDVAKHLIKGKLDFHNQHVNELESDEAAITQMNGQRVGAYKDDNGELYLVDTTCTHLGCEVNWNSGEKSWDCPCHGSRFSYTGEVLEGPAVQPLKRYKPETE